MSYDIFYDNSGIICRLVLERKYPTHDISYDIIPHSFNYIQVEEYPELKNACRFMNFSNEMTMLISINTLQLN